MFLWRLHGHPRRVPQVHGSRNRLTEKVPNTIPPQSLFEIDGACDGHTYPTNLRESVRIKTDIQNAQPAQTENLPSYSCFFFSEVIERRGNMGRVNRGSLDVSACLVSWD